MRVPSCICDVKTAISVMLYWKEARQGTYGTAFTWWIKQNWCFKSFIWAFVDVLETRDCRSTCLCMTSVGVVAVERAAARLRKLMYQGKMLPNTASSMRICNAEWLAKSWFFFLFQIRCSMHSNIEPASHIASIDNSNASQKLP